MEEDHWDSIEHADIKGNHFIVNFNVIIVPVILSSVT